MPNQHRKRDRFMTGSEPRSLRLVRGNEVEIEVDSDEMSYVSADDFPEFVTLNGQRHFKREQRRADVIVYSRYTKPLPKNATVHPFWIRESGGTLAGVSQ